MKETIKKHPYVAVLIALVVGALFLAAPVALVAMKVKERLGMKPGTDAGGPANKLAAEKNNPTT